MLKAQSALEFLIIMSIAMTLIIIILNLSFTYFSTYSESVNIAKSRNVAEKIIWAAALVYSEGEGSTTKITVVTPGSIDTKGSYIDRKEVNIRIRTSGGISDSVVPSKIPIIGSLPIHESVYELIIKNERNMSVVKLNLPVSWINLTTYDISGNVKTTFSPSLSEYINYTLELKNLTNSARIVTPLEVSLTKFDESASLDPISACVTTDSNGVCKGSFRLSPTTPTGLWILSCTEKGYGVVSSVILNVTS